MRKVLIITYYWPPSGGVGVQRWLKFSKYLPAHKWTPIIYTPSNPEFGLKDNSLDKDLPKEVQVIRKPIWEPFLFYRRLLGKKGVSTRQGIVNEGKDPSFLKKTSIWLRGNLFLPDPRVFWVRPSVAFLTRFLKENEVDLVVTTGPPHSIHLIGLTLKKRMGIKWLADFRDPWSDWDLLPRLYTSSLALKYHRNKENEVMKNCDALITVSPTLGELYKKRCNQVTVITNGFDGELFPEIPVSDKFRISHVGMLNEIKNPELLWNVLEELCQEDPLFARDLEIHLAGTVSGFIIDRLKESCLRSNLRHHDYLSHPEVYQLYRSSYVLLLLMNQSDNAKWIIPVKLFEYLQTGKLILALGTQNTDANPILKKITGEQFIPYDEYDLIRKNVLEHYQQFKKGVSTQAKTEARQFSREQLTYMLSGLMEEVVSG